MLMYGISLKERTDIPKTKYFQFSSSTKAWKYMLKLYYTLEDEFKELMYKYNKF